MPGTAHAPGIQTYAIVSAPLSLINSAQADLHGIFYRIEFIFPLSSGSENFILETTTHFYNSIFTCIRGGRHMKQEYTKMLSDILNQMANTDHIRPTDIPDIDLYMDQVTSFMNDRLQKSKRYEDDKILTKTMINNYTKNKLLPPPEKKRYSREHMLVLIFIYYFKGFLPLGDIQAILQPLTDRFFRSEDDFNIHDIYSEIYEMGKDQISESIHDIMDSFRKASHSFEDCPGENREFLQMYAFICLLSFDIYLKKGVIQSMIDSLPALSSEPNKKET